MLYYSFLLKTSCVTVGAGNVTCLGAAPVSSIFILNE